MTRALPCAAAALVLSLGSVARMDAQSTDGTATSNIVFSTVPAILVTVDGDPILRDVAGTNLQRVVNTKALILRDEADVYYLKILDGWMQAYALGSWWEVCDAPPRGAGIALRQATTGSSVDLLTSSTMPLGSRRSLNEGDPPEVYVSTSPAILVVTNGPLQFATVPGTALEYATNTSAHVFKEPTDSELYLSTSNGWYRSWRTGGPWQTIGSDDLPRDIAQLPWGLLRPAGGV